MRAWKSPRLFQQNACSTQGSLHNATVPEIGGDRTSAPKIRAAASIPLMLIQMILPRSFGVPFVLSMALAQIPAQAADPGVLTDVTGGQIRGRLLLEGAGAVFRGIPFAQPPVGDLRWREPMPVVPWQGARDAGKPGAPAAQAPAGWNDEAAAHSSEDCLYLDVWSPMKSAKGPMPVMVWIHGGGNVAGAGGFDPLFDGRLLIRHDVVLVVIEYRLGALGFLSLPGLTAESPHHSSGNYAILDQIAALRWVHDNAAQFGGDMRNVTAFGQSAGAVDIMALLASPLTRGLIQRAIVESGPLPSIANTATFAGAEQAGMAAISRLNPPAKDPLGYLRSLSASEIFKLNGYIQPFAADGWVFPKAPARTYADGEESRIPLIVGSNAIEFPADGTVAEMRESIRKFFGSDAPRALELYGLSDAGKPAAIDPLYGDMADQWGSDRFRCPSVVAGGWHSDAGNPTWQYQFDRAIPPHPKTGHSSELPYVFGNLLANGSQAGRFQEADRVLSRIMQGYWTNFAWTGNPNGPGLPDWPAFDTKARKYAEFTAMGSVAVGADQRGPFSELFRAAMLRP
jgi:para-nitrobenzyl esterase